MIGAGVALPSTLEAFSKREPLTKSARILWAGTSSEAARWCGTGPKGMNGARDRGYVMIAGKRLESHGLTVNTQGYFGEQNNDLSIDALVGYDRRLHGLKGLTVNGAYSQMGGYPLRFAPDVDGEYGIHFEQAGDTVVFYISRPWREPSPKSPDGREAADPADHIEYSIDDGESKSFAFSNDKVQRVVVSGLPPGRHRLRLSTRAGENRGSVNFHGAECFLSTNTEIRFMPVGARAWNTGDKYWTRLGGYSAIAMLPIIQPDIVIATFGGGDEDEYGRFVQRCETWGDAVVDAGARPVFIGKPYRNAAYYEAIAALSEKYRTPTRNMGVITEAQAKKRGEKAADHVHFYEPWHRREGEALGDWLFETALPQLGLLRTA